MKMKLVVLLASAPPGVYIELTPPMPGVNSAVV